MPVDLVGGPRESRDRSRSPPSRSAPSSEPRLPPGGSRSLGRVRWYSGRKQIGVVIRDDSSVFFVPQGGAVAGRFVPPNPSGLFHGTRVSFIAALATGKKPPTATDVVPEPEELQRQCGLECGVETMLGGRDYNEDRVLGHDVYDLGFLAGIFDGHGGAACSEYVSRRLGVALHEAYSIRARKLGRGIEKITVGAEEDLISGAFEDAYETIDAEWLKYARDANGVQAGSTGLALLVAHGFEAVRGTCSILGCGGGVAKLFVANCGDCRAVLIRGREAVRLSEDHKPEMEQERKRIEKAGGVVIPPQGRTGSWRLGSKDGGGMYLSTSRSFGDLNLKEPKALVTAKPDVTVHNLQPEDWAVVMGCDGVWDVVEDQDAANVVMHAFAMGFAPCEVAKAVCKRAFSLGSRDNITVFVMRFNWAQPPKVL